MAHELGSSTKMGSRRAGCSGIKNTSSRDEKFIPPFMHTALMLVVINTSHSLPISMNWFGTTYTRTPVRLNANANNFPFPTNMPTRQSTSSFYTAKTGQ